MYRCLAFVTALLATAPQFALADPPGRVGRISETQGEVALFADPQLGWETAFLNSHVTSENSLWTEPGARAEVSIGSTALRLEELTQLDVERLDDDTFRAHLARGNLSIRIRFLEAGETYALSTAQARFQLRTNGRYRLDADPESGESRLSVFSGSARLEATGGFVQVEEGRSVRVTGGARASYSFESAYSTALDEWSLARDERIARREPSRFVSPRMTGWEDLDEYGDWRSEPEYGTLWFPTRVEAGWAPYRDGRWTWVRPWGWTWVDDAPWGYAPFHYGRWVQVNGRWGWYPGRYVARPVWAPALVAWVGGPGWSVSIGSRGPANVIDWYPLSPYDRYDPWYPANVTYVNRINQVTVVRPGREHRGDREWHSNRDAGATIVAREIFTSRRPVRGSTTVVPRETLDSQPVMPGRSVLPPRDAIRPHSKPMEVSPNMPASRPFAGSRAIERAPAAGTPVARPMPVAPAAPVAPPPARVTRPPQATDRVVPAERTAPVEHAVPGERVAPRGGAKPREIPEAQPRPAESSQRRVRPMEVAPGEAAQPQAKPVPQPPPPEQRRTARESRESRGAASAPAPATAPVPPEARPVQPPEARGAKVPAARPAPKPQAVEPASDKEAKPGQQQK